MDGKTRHRMASKPVTVGMSFRTNMTGNGDLWMN